MRVSWLALGAIVCVSLVLGYCGATEVHDRRAADWLEWKDSTLHQSALKDAELAHLDLELIKWKALAGEVDTVTLPAPRPEPPLVPRETRDTVQALQALVDTLWREGQQFRARIDRDAERLAAFGRVVALQDSTIGILRADRDSLRVLVQAAPVGRVRGIRILGVRLCPVVGPSYSVQLGGAHGPGVAVVQPLSCG